MKIYVDKNALQDYTTKLIAKEKTIFATKDQVGSPLVASTVAGMTDHDKIYVYVGSETGYTSGNWYYWDGTAWTSGGVYNSEGFVLDDTLTSATLPAQAKAVGDKVNQLSEDIDDTKTDIENLSNMVLPYTGKFLIPAPLISNTYIDVDNGGELKPYAGWSTTQPVPLDGAETMYIPSTFSRYHAFYADKTIESFVSATGTGNVSIPATAKYVRFSFQDSLAGELDKVSTDKYGYDAVLVDAITSRKQGLNSADKWAEFEDDADNLPINKILQITYSTDVLHLPVNPFSGTMITFDFDPASVSKGVVQLAFKSSGEIYKRIKWGTTWRDWYQVVTSDMLPDVRGGSLDTAYKGLGNFVACGDSITVSLSYPTQGESGIPVKSWAESFAELCGSETVIYAQGGRDTAAFLASADYTAAVADTSQFAFLFLGINDCNGNVEIETYTSNYTQIVNALLQNHKFVFCVNIPAVVQSSSRRSLYNAAIESVCESISKAFLVDITGASSDLSPFANYGHLSSIGYARLAGEIAKAVNVTMLANNYFDGQIDIDSQS